MQTYMRTEEVQAFKVAYSHGNTFSDTAPSKYGKMPKSATTVELSNEIVSRYTPKIGQYLSFQNGQFHGVHAATFFEATYEEVVEPISD